MSRLEYYLTCVLLCFGTWACGGGDSRQADAGLDCPALNECGAACCDSTEVCGSNDLCCPQSELCGSTCCGQGETCEGAVCQPDCGTAVRCDGLCCAAAEICTLSGCFEPTVSCEDFLDCPNDTYCELTLEQCLPQPTGESCQSAPSGGAVVPALLWHWDGSENGIVAPAHNQVMMTPMVANLSDDNGDSVIDTLDTPDVVFITFADGVYQRNGIIRVVDGATGATRFSISDPSYRVNPGGQVAIGDIDNDGFVEIVACSSSASGRGALVAFNHDGSLLWFATDPANGNAATALCGQAAPAIADLDADGIPEVFVRHSVVDGATGKLEWQGSCSDLVVPSYTAASHDPCDYSTAADLDGDGKLELIGGNVAYTASGAIYYDHRSTMHDGYPAVGDLDNDGSPEVVVAQSSWAVNGPYNGQHTLTALRFDGSPFWGPVDVNATNPNVPNNNQLAGGGPPTIANFDSDLNPEIALATAFHYVVFEHDGTVKWYRDSDDGSSRKTGSSVFDFDGDGVAEAVYSDHQWMRVYDGPTGDIEFCLCNTSATLWEYPVTVDVNNDGATEIVVASNDFATDACAGPALDICTQARLDEGATAGTHGVRVFASPAQPWVATRRIWNQHSYHVTNVGEDGSIPMVERRNWLLDHLNNFRQNVQPGASNQPDLRIYDQGVGLQDCADQLHITFAVQNDGWAASPVGVPVAVYVELAGVYTFVGSVQTTTLLLPGAREVLTVDYTLTGSESAPSKFRIVVNDPTQSPLATLIECKEDNNSADTAGGCSFID